MKNSALLQAHVETAKQVALTQSNGTYRRARFAGHAINFIGYKDNNGQAYVIADYEEDLQQIDTFISINTLAAIKKYPAIKVENI